MENEINMKTPRSLSIRLALPMLVALGLAGCGGFNGPEYAQFDASYAHPISVQPDVPTLSIAAASSMSVDERRAVTGFAAAFKERGHGSLTVAAPSGSANSAMAISVLADVRDTLAKAGVSADRISYTPYRASSAAERAPVILSYKRFVAVATPCGAWTEDYAFDPRNLPPANFGCASQNNLAAMVSDPADLIAPRVMTASDAQRRGVVFDKYRKGEITATNRDDHDSAALSEVAK